MNEPPQSRTSGYAAGIGAFLFWGLIPPFWKAIAHVDTLEILAHRVIWAAIFCAILLAALGRWKEVKAAACSLPTMGILAVAGLLLGVAIKARPRRSAWS